AVRGHPGRRADDHPRAAARQGARAREGRRVTMAGEPEWTRPEEHYSFQDGVPRVLVGELYGLRSFKVTDDGWLTGVSFPKPWAPGTNKSECWAVTAWEADGMHTTHKPRQVNLIHDNPDL